MIHKTNEAMMIEPQWDYYFDEMGGERNATDAWIVHSNGIRLKIDCKDFGQSCWKDEDETSIDRAEEFAQHVVACMEAFAIAQKQPATPVSDPSGHIVPPARENAT